MRMGALTGNRKRCFIDLCLPFSPDFSPPSKKPKHPSTPPISDRKAPSRRFPAFPAFPPAASLPRPVHGPQRNIRAFGLGSGRSSQRTPSEWGLGFAKESASASKMGNFLCRLFRSEKDRRPGDWNHEGLGLEQYKKMVGHSATVSDVRSFSPVVSDLTALTRKSEEPSDSYVLNRKVEHARKVTLDSVPVREVQGWVKKGPAYKELYEEAKKRDSILSSLEFNVKLTEEQISAFRLASAAREKKPKPKEDLNELFTPLTDEEEDEVSDALQGGNSHEVLVTHEASNIEITREILQCLSYGAWLNDEVINLYLGLLKERERREPKRFLKCHFFNTFFYKKLTSGRNGYDFKAVRRWTTQRKLGYGLIECDKVFVPIHKDIHWCLAVINVKNETFQYLDSLGGMDIVVLRVLARYFMDEVKDKSDKQIDTSSWKQEIVVDLPHQKNGWDCGMFMLKYADFYSRGLNLCFNQDHMEYFRKRTAKEILSLRAE